MIIPRSKIEVICLYCSIVGSSGHSCSDTRGNRVFISIPWRCKENVVQGLCIPIEHGMSLYCTAYTLSWAPHPLQRRTDNAVSPRVVGCCTNGAYPIGDHNHVSRRSGRSCVEEISGCGDTLVDISAPTVVIVVVDKFVEIFQGVESPGIIGINVRSELNIRRRVSIAEQVPFGECSEW